MTKGKTGRPEVKWTERDCNTFKALCSQFNTEHDICAVMGLDNETLMRLVNEYLYEDITGHKRRGTAKKVTFSQAFKKYSSNGRVSLRRSQYRKAVDEGNVPMLIWLGKQYLDQREAPIGNEDEEADRAIREMISAMGLE